jgi:hypothetical protein
VAIVARWGCDEVGGRRAWEQGGREDVISSRGRYPPAQVTEHASCEPSTLLVLAAGGRAAPCALVEEEVPAAVSAEEEALEDELFRILVERLERWENKRMRVITLLFLESAHEGGLVGLTAP